MVLLALDDIPVFYLINMVQHGLYMIKLMLIIEFLELVSVQALSER